MNIRIHRIAPLAAALLFGGALAGCGSDDAPPRDSTAANSPIGNTAPATPGEPTGTEPGTPATGTAATTTDNTAMADTSGTMAGAGMDNTAAGSTVGDMSASGVASPATTSADASAMAMAASGPVTASAFYAQALAGGAKEIAASQLAQQSGTDKVDQLAAMMIKDHTAMGEKVKAAAGTAAPTPPKPDTAMLAGKDGAALDRAYADQMVRDHEQAIAMFENASRNAGTDEAKKLASDALPKLRQHLEAARSLQQSLQ